MFGFACFTKWIFLNELLLRFDHNKRNIRNVSALISPRCVKIAVFQTHFE